MSRNMGVTLEERLSRAADAKKAMLTRFRAVPGPDDPAVAERRIEREAILKAREIRTAEREAAKKTREAEMAAQAAREAELAAQAEREAAEKAAKAAADQVEFDALLAAEQKAARDARYAARKAAKKQRRKGY
jgi:hypothetical protein